MSSKKNFFVFFLILASLPGMWERTITIGSAGKTFSVTGWKLGWSYGPANLIKPMQLYHQNCVYTCATPLQEAVAIGLEQEMEKIGANDSYFKILSSDLQIKRDKIVDILVRGQMIPTIPEGGYFLLADFSKLSHKFDYHSESGHTNDHKFVRWLSKNKVKI